MRVGIVGGGFAGLAAAIAFRQCGHDVTVLERLRGPEAAGGAISLAPNALACLSILGVRHRVVTQPWSHVPATVRTSDGRVLVRSTLAGLTGGDEYAAVQRSELIRWLAAELPDDVVRFGTAVTGVSADGSIVADGITHRFDLVVGADGSRGVVRKALWPKAPAIRSTGITGWAWIVNRELTTGFGPIWGRTADFGVLPLGDGRTYVYGGTSVRGVGLSSFRGWPPPLPELIDAADRMVTPEIFEARPPRRLDRGNVVLIGDAAHTMRPTFGQGAALAMEDAIALAYGGVPALMRRRARIIALYGLSKAGSFVAQPRWPAAEFVRDAAVRSCPDAVFGTLAGSVSRWHPPQRSA